MNNKKLIRLFTISSLALSLTAGSSFAMEHDDDVEDTGAERRAQKSPKPTCPAENADLVHLDDESAATIIHGPAVHHPETAVLQAKFAPTYIPPELFSRVFGSSVEEFNALAARFYKVPTQTDATPSSPLPSRGAIDEDVAAHMSAVRKRLEDSLRPWFGFEPDTGRYYATGTWRVSESAISQHVAELRRQAQVLRESASLMRSLNRSREATDQDALRDLMMRSASSLDSLYRAMQASSEFESFSMWKYLKPKDAHPRHLALWVTPLNLGLYEEALAVSELMARKSGELAEHETFDLTHYRPLPFTQGPTLEEMRRVLYPPQQADR